MITQNPDKDFYKEITQKVKDNDGYYPCSPTHVLHHFQTG